MTLEKKPSINLRKSIFADVASSEMIDQLQNFISIEHIYNSAIKEISTKLEILDDEFRIKYEHNPIHHIESRLKSPRSIAEKLKRKGQEISLSSAAKNLTDIAGVRVICYYIEDVYKIAELLCGQNDVKLVRKTDYIKEPKPNGYRSLHLVVKVPIFLSERVEDAPVEIQIRTIAMDCWASLEHQLRYKGVNIEDPELNRRLKDCSDYIAQVDSEMQDIHRTVYREEKN